MCVSAGLGKEGVPIRPRRVNPTDRHRDPSEAARSPCSFMDKTATKAEASPTKSEVPDQGVNPFFLFDLPSLRYFRFSLKKRFGLSAFAEDAVVGTTIHTLQEATIKMKHFSLPTCIWWISRLWLPV
jgi:hypothetical protein